jgi:hypothetical protein
VAGEGGVISTEAGCTRAGKPFVITLVNGEKFGQITPAEAIAMGTRFIQHGIEAERDGGMVAYLREQGFSDKKIAEEIAQMRDHREQYDPPEAKA